MTDVKLFRVTEFAESVFQSPLAHRNAMHPLWLMLIVAVWIGTAGHWPIWQALILRSDPGALQPALAAAVATQLSLAGLVWLALGCWRRTLKPAIALVLLWAALGSCAMWLQSVKGETVALSPSGLLQFLLRPANWPGLWSWPCIGSFLGIAVFPSLIIWQGHTRRISFAANFLMNAALLIVAIAGLAWLAGRFSHIMPSPMDPWALLGI